jgi:hypothetical protein
MAERVPGVDDDAWVPQNFRDGGGGVAWRAMLPGGSPIAPHQAAMAISLELDRTMHSQELRDLLPIVPAQGRTSHQHAVDPGTAIAHLGAGHSLVRRPSREQGISLRRPGSRVESPETQLHKHHTGMPSTHGEASCSARMAET